MKDTDLMIGDWVNIVDEDGNILMPIKVYGLKEFGEKKYYQPIPLTPEILEKNGFKRGTICPSKWYLGGRGYGQMCLAIFKHSFYLTHCVEFEGDDFESFIEPQVALPLEKCLFVHTLQHALHLCGLDDLRLNFKI